MKHATRFLILFILVFAAAACGDKSIKPELTVVELDTLLTDGPAKYEARYQFMSITNTDASPSLQAIEEANIEYFFGLEGFTGTAADALRETRAELMRIVASDRQDMESTGRVWEHTTQISSQATVVDTLLVYTISMQEYAGGAHGISRNTTHNYSIAGGYELTLADLFTPAQREALDKLIRTKLYEQYGATDDNSLAALGFFPEYLQATENFIITSDGITFYYNPYDIAYYALGSVEVPISKSELDKL